MTPDLLRHDGWDEIVLSLAGRAGEAADDTLLRAVSALHREGADVVRAAGFVRVCPGGTPLLRPRGVPVTYVEGAPCGGGDVSGVQVVGARGGSLTCYDTEQEATVVVVEDDHARWAFVSGVAPAALWAPAPVQALEAFERAEAALRLAGLDFRHVFRTWVFVDDILGWYDELNQARTSFYRERRVFEGLVPASTGIGAANPVGAAIALDLLAVAPKDDCVSVKRLASPLQCPALDYGSSFSRAVEITEPGLRRVLVSGTASIAADGTTAHVGDVCAQTDLTLDVVEAILRSSGMDWPDVTRAVAYFRRAEDSPVLEDRWSSRGGPDLPVIVTESVICRDELLFEIEVDAAQQA